MRYVIPLVFLLVSGCAHGGAPTETPAPPSGGESAGQPKQKAPEQAGASHESGHGHDSHGAGDGDGYARDFSAAQAYARRFDSSARDAWQKPAEVVRLLQVEPDQTVADVGAGTGYFLPALCEAVGSDGRVWALDVEPNMVRYIEARAREEGLRQVEAMEVAPDDPGLADESVDRILIVNTWHHISDRGRYAGQLRRALRDGGMVMIVDFTLESDQGPPPQYRLAPGRVVEELARGGLEAEVVEETLPKQYVVIARAQAP